MLDMQFGRRAGEVGVFDALWLAIIALAAFIVSAAVNGWARGDYTRLDVMLGLVNMALVAGLLAYVSVAWAFNRPHHPIAYRINSLSRLVLKPDHYASPDVIRPARRDMSSSWVTVEPNMWRSEELGLILKREIVATCFDPGFIAANQRARLGRENEKLPTYAQIWGDVYYTLDGEYLSAGQLNGVSLTYIEDPDLGFRPYRYLPDSRQGTPEAIAFLSRQLMHDLQNKIAVWRRDQARRSYYSRAEIDALVAEAWDDDVQSSANEP